LKILLVSATLNEIKGLLENLGEVKKNSDIHYMVHYQNLDVDVLICGIGPSFSNYQLTKLLTNRNYDLVVNVGICGSYNSKLQIGDLVNVTNDCFADLGIESPDKFTTLFEEGLMNADEFPFRQGKIVNEGFPYLQCVEKLPKVSGITVNSANGNAEGIVRATQKFNPDIESMEGAAVFYVCKLEKVNVLQLRAISNHVEPRDKKNWNIPIALKNLQVLIMEVLSELDLLGL
jgi:futalosine hydrolase